MSIEEHRATVLQRRDEAERLGNDIAELAARIQAATYELLVMIRAFDQREGWSGFKSCAHWLNWRTGLALGAAREKVRVARALGDLPLLSDAMQRGRISYSKVRALTRVATAANERRRSGSRSARRPPTSSGWRGRGAGSTGRQRRPTSGGGTNAGT